jgi:hypothetical protein
MHKLYILEINYKNTDNNVTAEKTASNSSTCETNNNEIKGIVSEMYILVEINPYSKKPNIYHL